MAKRRMFSKEVIDTDNFLEMPATTQMLYFHLSMRADDDGFVSNPKRILRLTGCSDDDLKILHAKQFIIPFDSGICVIRHWKIHNYIQKDRYNKTIYHDELDQLTVLENGTYQKANCECIQDGYKMDTQVRLGKESKEYSCSEDSDESIEASPVFIEFPMVGSASKPRATHKVTESDILKYEDVYPSVNIRQELKRMKLWFETNPTKKKKNVPLFIARWLAKEQDKPHNKNSSKNDIHLAKSVFDGVRK